MERKDFSDLEKQIMGSVQAAIDSMDFKNLNQKISGTVNIALNEARNQLIHGLHGVRKGQDVYRRNYKYYEDPHGGGVRNRMKERMVYADECRGGKESRPEALKLCRRNRFLGLVFTVFGAMGLAAAAVLAPVIYLLTLAVKPFWGGVVGAFLLLIILGAAFACLMGAGISICGRLKRARLYLQQAGSRLYCDIGELAKGIGKSRRFVVKDLRRLIEKGILPQAHIDEQKTCLMLDDETYRQYLAAQESLKRRELSDREDERKKRNWFWNSGRRRQEKSASKEGRKDNEAGGNGLGKGTGDVLEASFSRGEPDPLPDGLREMMEQGRGYLRVLREANEAIPGEAISGKLTRLETVIRKIFDTVERKPEQMEEMERFMDYYLPTTVKLITAYRDFDRVEIEGGNIAAAKHEIEETLDTINSAFERLLDDLYQNAAMDVSADASVLQAMLKKDGFAESDFTRRDEQ